MANTKPKTLTANLNIALEPKNRKLINAAAKVVEELPSVWARAVLIEAANRILSQKPR